MCNAKGLLGFFYPPSLLGWNSDKKAKRQANAAINAANQAAANQVEQNKLASF